MRSICRVVTAASLLALPAPSLAQSPQPGVGNTTCAQFIRAARAGDILYHQASNWLLGYVSGMNAALRAGGQAAAVTLNSDQLMKSAGDYCEANPARTIANAAAEWYPTLPRQADTAKPSDPRGSDWTVTLGRDKTPFQKR